jgi:hypothetical protein
MLKGTDRQPMFLRESFGKGDDIDAIGVSPKVDL